MSPYHPAHRRTRGWVLIMLVVVAVLLAAALIASLIEGRREIELEGPLIEGRGPAHYAALPERISIAFRAM